MLTVLPTEHGCRTDHPLVSYRHSGGLQIGFVDPGHVTSSLSDFTAGGAEPFRAAAGGQALLRAMPEPTDAPTRSGEREHHLFVIVKQDRRGRPAAACRPLLQRIRQLDADSREHIDPTAGPDEAELHLNHVGPLMYRVFKNRPGELSFQDIGEFVLAHPHYVGVSPGNLFPGFLKGLCLRAARLICRAGSLETLNDICGFLMSDTFERLKKWFLMSPHWEYDPDRPFSPYMGGKVNGVVWNAMRAYWRYYNNRDQLVLVGDWSLVRERVVGRFNDDPALLAELNDLVGTKQFANVEELLDAIYGKGTHYPRSR